MPEDQLTKIYSTILDVQRQIGDVNGKTDSQTEIIKAISVQTNKTNDRVTALEGQVMTLQLSNANNAGKSSIKMALWSALGAIVLTIIATLLSNYLKFIS